MNHYEMTTAHLARSSRHSDEWYAAKALPKDERKIERLMVDMANKVASEVINAMHYGE